MLENTRIKPEYFTPEIGAYSHGIKAPLSPNVNMIFITGQIALTKEGEIYYPNDIEKQAEFVFNNIDTILKEAGSAMSDVVKTQIFLTDINDFKKLTKIRNIYFQESKPVSTMLEVSRLVKGGCVIEIEVIAVQKERSALKRLLNTIKNIF